MKNKTKAERIELAANYLEKHGESIDSKANIHFKQAIILAAGYDNVLLNIPETMEKINKLS